MKHIFMINRFSLREKLDKYTQIIEKVAKKLELDYIIEINDDIKSTEDILEKYKNDKAIIYAVGGDGIINRVVNAIYGTKNKLSCIPAGTGNDFNRTINEFFKDGDNDVDLIKCNDKYFINVACFGVDADIANDEAIVHNKFIPRAIQYKLGVVKHIILYKPYTFTMEWDDGSMKSKLSLVTVCNASYYGGGFHVNPKGIYNDGLIDVYVSLAQNRRQLTQYLLKILKAQHEELKLVQHIKTKKFTITAEKEVVGNLDGEPLKTNKFEMTVLPKAMTVFYNKKLIEEINKELER